MSSGFIPRSRHRLPLAIVIQLPHAGSSLGAHRDKVVLHVNDIAMKMGTRRQRTPR